MTAPCQHDAIPPGGDRCPACKGQRVLVQGLWFHDTWTLGKRREITAEDVAKARKYLNERNRSRVRVEARDAGIELEER